MALLDEHELEELRENYQGFRCTFYEDGEYHKIQVNEIYFKDDGVFAEVENQNGDSYSLKWDLIANENFSDELL